MLATQTEDLLQQDRAHAVHPLQFSEDQARTTIFIEGKGAILKDIEGTSTSTASPASGTSTSATAAKSLPRRPPSRCASSPSPSPTPAPPTSPRSSWPTSSPRLLPEPERGLLHHRRRRVQRVGLQDRPLLLEGQGQAGQDQVHRAAAGATTASPWPR